MRLSEHDRAAIDSVLQSIYALQDLDGFTATVMQQLPGLVDSELTSYNEVNFESRRMMVIIDSQSAQTLFHERQVAFEALMHENPLIEHSARVRDRPKKISDFISVEQWRQTAIYHEFYGQLDVNYQIALVLTLETEAIIAFAFNRSQNDFTERHRAILSMLQPHLTQA